MRLEGGTGAGWRERGKGHGLSLLLHVLAVVILAMLPAPAPDPGGNRKTYDSISLVAPAAPVVRWPPRTAVKAPSRPQTPAPRFAFAAPVKRLTRRQLPDTLTPRIPMMTPEIAARLPAVAPAAPATPPPAVQTGVFGELPVLPGAAPKPVLPVETGVFSAVEASSQTDTARRRTVTGSFETAGAAPPAGLLKKRVVRSTGFGDVVAVAAADAPRRTVEQPASAPGVEILYKPKPEYTEEARRKKIEGVVTLEVLFARSGEVKVLAVARGLGYGLDEQAIDAARRIRFQPATQEGQPVDSTATVQIVFQLAY